MTGSINFHNSVRDSASVTIWSKHHFLRAKKHRCKGFWKYEMAVCLKYTLCTFTTVVLVSAGKLTKSLLPLCKLFQTSSFRDNAVILLKENANVVSLLDLTVTCWFNVYPVGKYDLQNMPVKLFKFNCQSNLPKSYLFDRDTIKQIQP